MIDRALKWGMRGFALFFLGIAAVITFSQLSAYRQAQTSLPAGTVVAGIPLGGLSRSEAAQRLEQAYGQPVELHYGPAVFQAHPAELGFRLESDTMLAQAAAARSFWDFLWNHAPATQASIPLQASLDEAALRAYLTGQVASRYDTPPVAPNPVAGSIEFTPGQAGQQLDVEASLAAVSAALRSPDQRAATLTVKTAPAPAPLLENLKVMLRQQLALAGFDGVAEIYLAGLKNGQTLNFAQQDGQEIPVGVAFTAASTIKIPVMVSIYRHTAEPMPDGVLSLVRAMIAASDNPSTDLVVQTVLDGNLGPLQVTEDIGKLGLENTFWAGYFYDGAPLLQAFETPANRRQDVNTHPDVYNQTSPADMGRLLAGIYHCAQDGTGDLVSAFPGEITQAECQQMIGLLEDNRIAVLLEAGLPEGTQIAHKHGWIQGTDGLMHDIADAGLIFTPGGDYALAVYLSTPQQQLLFDPANELVARLSRAVYNYFNPPVQ